MDARTSPCALPGSAVVPDKAGFGDRFRVESVVRCGLESRFASFRGQCSRRGDSSGRLFGFNASENGRRSRLIAVKAGARRVLVRSTSVGSPLPFCFCRSDLLWRSCPSLRRACWESPVTAQNDFVTATIHPFGGVFVGPPLGVRGYTPMTSLWKNGFASDFERRHGGRFPDSTP